MENTLTQNVVDLSGVCSIEVKTYIREFLTQTQKDSIVSISKDGSLIASSLKSENITSSKTQNAVHDLHSLRAALMKQAKA